MPNGRLGTWQDVPASQNGGRARTHSCATYLRLTGSIKLRFSALIACPVDASREMGAQNPARAGQPYAHANRGVCSCARLRGFPEYCRSKRAPQSGPTAAGLRRVALPALAFFPPFDFPLFAGCRTISPARSHMSAGSSFRAICWLMCGDCRKLNATVNEQTT